MRAPVDDKLRTPLVAVVRSEAIFMAAELSARSPAVAVQPAVVVTVRSPVTAALASPDVMAFA